MPAVATAAASGIHGAARVAQRAEYPVGALHDDREIGADGARRACLRERRSSRTRTADPGAARGIATKLKRTPGGLILRLAFAARAAIRPVDVRLDRPGDMRAQVAVTRLGRQRACRGAGGAGRARESARTAALREHRRRTIGMPPAADSASSSASLSRRPAIQRRLTVSSAHVAMRAAEMLMPQRLLLVCCCAWRPAPRNSSGRTIRSSASRCAGGNLLQQNFQVKFSIHNPNDRALPVRDCTPI